MPNPTAAMLVIGDEILSGRTRDANMHHLAGQLTDAGIDLKEVRVVSDDRPAIIAAVQALSGAYDHVFTSGGIGPTHDDITADCIAAAFSVGIDIRDDARALLQAHYDRNGQELNSPFETCTSWLVCHLCFKPWSQASCQRSQAAHRFCRARCA